MRDIHTGFLKLKIAVDDQSNFASELRNIDKGPKSLKKVFDK